MLQREDFGHIRSFNDAPKGTPKELNEAIMAARQRITNLQIRCRELLTNQKNQIVAKDSRALGLQKDQAKLEKHWGKLLEGL